MPIGLRRERNGLVYWFFTLHSFIHSFISSFIYLTQIK